ncbi:MAG: chemotaxis protein CheA [Nitrospirae bacterium]|nr:chemotaxis protein CheA [Nitrospirota bacterium]
MEEIEKLKETFYQEADDILNNLDGLLLQLEGNPGDRETLDGIFRSMHTLKGSSGIFEFHGIERLAHACEDLLDFMRNEDNPPIPPFNKGGELISPFEKGGLRGISDEISTEKMIDTLFSGLDQIKGILSSIQAGKKPSESDYEDTVRQIRAILPAKEAPTPLRPLKQVQGQGKLYPPHLVGEKEGAYTVYNAGLNKAFLRNLKSLQLNTLLDHTRSGKKIYQISIALNKYCFFKGIDPLVLLKNLSAAGEILYVRCPVDHLPSLDDLNTSMLYFDDIWLIFSAEGSGEFINDICEFAVAVGDITAHAITENEINFITTSITTGSSPTSDDWEMPQSANLSDDQSTGQNDDDINTPESAAASTGLRTIFFEFMEESNTYLEEIESLILRLEKDKDNLDIVNDIFRPFHTIKGNCGYLGIKEIGHICHSIETLLDCIRNRQLSANQKVIDILLVSVDIVKRLRLGLPWSVRDRFGLTDNDLSKYPQYDEAIDTNPLIQKIEMLINSALVMKDANDVPKIGEILMATGAITEEQLNRALKLQERRIGEILVEEGIVHEDKVKTALEIQEYHKASVKAPSGAIKVDTDKVDSLVNLVGELVISQTLISQNPQLAHLIGQGIQKDISHLGKITREIQDLVMSIRMIPLKQTFQKMMRVVRDVAKKAGKNVDLIISGEDTELDKSVIEEISDPLVHILRNAVDHGIEPPEERMLKGKPEKGAVYLNAFHRGGSIVIEIKDDGMGLCREKILQKAVEKELLDDASGVGDQQIYQLIFQAGFSTAEKVTDISGRGVGLDVVRRNIEKLRGRIDIQSKEGSGTSISIILPLTLAIIDGMVVQVGGEKYIIPTLSIEESLRPKKEEIITVQNKGELCNLRGNLLPLVRLSRLYNAEPVYKNPWDALLVVVESDGMRSCIMVDELLGQQQVVIKTLGDTFKNVKGISGGAILGDGKVGLILDVRGVMEISIC